MKKIKILGLIDFRFCDDSLSDIWLIRKQIKIYINIYLKIHKKLYYNT